MANWWAPWTWFGEGRSHGDNFIRNLSLEDRARRYGLVVDEHTAMRLAAVLCAVRVIAEGIAQLPMKVYRETEENGQHKRTLARDHPAYGVLHRRPNAWMTAFEWRELMTMHAVLLGDGYSIIHRVGDKIEELIPVYPSAVQIEFDTAANDLRYRITVDGKQAIYKRNEVFRLRGPSMDGVTSLPIVKLAAEAIGLAQALENEQTELASNGGRPSGILSFEGDKLSPERRHEVSEAWRKKFGPGGDGGTAVLEAAWKYHAMTMSAVDQQHLESRKLQVEEIGRAFRVLPIMMMQSDKAATYASAEQMFLAHKIHTLGPWVDRWEQALDRDVIDDPEVYAHIEVNGFMRASSAERSEYYVRALGNGGATPGWMTQNEVRGLEELDPVTDGDTLFRPPTDKGPTTPEDPPEDA